MKRFLIGLPISSLSFSLSLPRSYHNISHLFKIVFLAVLVCDMCTKMFTIYFCAIHYLNILKILSIRKFIRVFYSTLFF